MTAKLYQLYAAQNSLETMSRNEMSSILRDADMMHEDEFWGLIPVLLENITDSFKRNGNPTSGGSYTSSVHSGIQEFIRSGCVNDDLDIVGFIKTYNAMVKKASADSVYEYLSENSLGGWSDDGWYDFTNKLPLYGKNAFEAIVNRTIEKGEHKEAFGHEEWYVASTLEDKAIPFVAMKFRDDTEEGNAFDLIEDEKSHELHTLRMELRNAQRTINEIKKLIK